jgi:nitrile hydratase
MAPDPQRQFDMVYALGEEPAFEPGDRIRIVERRTVGHYRVPTYVRGKRGKVEMVIKPPAVDNEEEGFGRNAGLRRYYYRVAIPMTEIWPHYSGARSDGLRIEVFESWLERV